MAILIIAAIVLTPLNWYPWLLLGISGATFIVFLICWIIIMFGAG